MCERETAEWGCPKGCVWGAIEIERGLGADDAWMENRWKFPQFTVFANKGRCLIFGFVEAFRCRPAIGFYFTRLYVGLYKSILTYFNLLFLLYFAFNW